MSLVRSKDVLKQYNIKKNLEIEKIDKEKWNYSKVIQAIMDRNFQHDLEDIIVILK